MWIKWWRPTNTSGEMLQQIKEKKKRKRKQAGNSSITQIEAKKNKKWNFLKQ